MNEKVLKLEYLVMAVLGSIFWWIFSTLCVPLVWMMMTTHQLFNLGHQKKYGKNFLNFVLLLTIGLPTYFIMLFWDYADFVKSLFKKNPDKVTKLFGKCQAGFSLDAIIMLKLALMELKHQKMKVNQLPTKVIILKIQKLMSISDNINKLIY